MLKPLLSQMESNREDLMFDTMLGLPPQNMMRRMQ
jgi:hypothetical protein